MNYTKHLLVPIICLLLLSCSKDNDENTDNNTPSTKTSLPVKVTSKDANGLTRTSTFSYDSQNRLKTLKVADANASLNYTTTMNYENGKITSLRDYDNPAKEIEKHIFRKAINIKAKQENSLFQFEKLKEEVEITSIEDLLKEEILGNFEVKFIINKDMEYDNISNQDKLNLVLKFLEKVFSELKNSIHPKKGSDFRQGRIEQFFSEPKTKTIKEDSDADRIFKEYLENENWYVLDSFNGTSEEKELIKFIKDSIGNLEAKHDEVYLLRNEEVYKIFDFEQGRGFQPDFILFLKGKDSLKYQIFIEPKGNDYIGDDGTFKSGKEGWKEEFLEEISNKYGFSNIIKAEHPNYRLIGLPFFNKDHNSEFNRKFETIID